MNAAALFRESAERTPDRLAFLHGRHQVTFSGLWDRVSRFHGGLAARGFGPGDRALIVLPMSIDLYIALLAVLKSGGVAMFLDPWVGVRQMIRLAVHSRPKAFLGGWKAQLLRMSNSELRAIPITRVEPGPPIPDMHPAAPDDRALITFTTGSSGNPKGVNRTHRILRAQHERLAEEFPPAAGDVDLCTFPVFALNNLALGVPTLIPPIDLRRVGSANAARVAREAVHDRVTTATASPPLFDLLANLEEPPRFRRILTGGAPVSDAQLRAWAAAWPDAEIQVAYGSSEAEPVASISARERLKNSGRGYLAGHIAHHVRARVIPIARGPVDAIRELPRGEIGELIVAGDHVCRDYDGDPQGERENKICEGDTVWHRMGDTGWFDGAGRFRIAGRVHSTIDREGVQVHAQLVEQAATGNDPSIRRAAALGIGGRVIVVIEVAPGTPTEAGTGFFTAVRDAVRSRVEAAGFPCDIVVVRKRPLPLDPRHNSKIDYARLQEQL